MFHAPQLTKFSLTRFWYLNMTSCLLRGDVCDHPLKAALADSTACSISACVFCGTRVTTSLVAGFGTSIHLVAAESTKRPSTQPCVLAGTLQPAKLNGRARFMADDVLAAAEAAPES